MIRIIVSLGILFLIGVLAYGYWFGVNHGALYITVLDVSDREHSRDAKPVQLTFRDGDGKVLAEAAGSEKSGAIFLSSPAEYSCDETAQREEWAKCFERQSTWLPTWVRQVRFADMVSNSCAIQRIPVSVSEHPDTWWLWWVPLRHIGGKPYTSFSFSIRFNRDGCRSTAYRSASHQVSWISGGTSGFINEAPPSA
jgi:hypothetical protein